MTLCQTVNSHKQLSCVEPQHLCCITEYQVCLIRAGLAPDATVGVWSSGAPTCTQQGGDKALADVCYDCVTFHVSLR